MRAPRQLQPTAPGHQGARPLSLARLRHVGEVAEELQVGLPVEAVVVAEARDEERAADVGGVGHPERVAVAAGAAAERGGVLALGPAGAGEVGCEGGGRRICRRGEVAERGESAAARQA